MDSTEAWKRAIADFFSDCGMPIYEASLNLIESRARELTAAQPNYFDAFNGDIPMPAPGQPLQAGTRKVTDEDVMSALRAAEPTRDWTSSDAGFPSLAWQMSRMRAALESFAANK